VNVSSGETLTLHVLVSRSAQLDVQVIDRDGFVIRALPQKKNAAVGDHLIVWDGRDDAGEIVPDEAYSFRIVADSGVDDYFPAAREAGMVVIDPLSYSNVTATPTYVLKAPSRVHVQAGTVRTAAEGPVLKTIVDRQPRGAGKVAEHWSGLDESASIYVPGLPGFAIAIAATPLPENSVITFGNTKRSFLEYASHRRGRSLFQHRHPAAHHAGLDIFNDVAPALTLAPLRAVYHSNERFWSVTDSVLRLQLRADGPTAEAFVRQPGKIFVFVDSQLAATRDAGRSADLFDVPLPEAGQHVIAVNWRSDYGPVAVAVARVRVERQTAQSASRP